MNLEDSIQAYREANKLSKNIISLRKKVDNIEKVLKDSLVEVFKEINKIDKKSSDIHTHKEAIREMLGILDIQYENKYGHICWVAKDADGVWFGFDDEPILRVNGWNGHHKSSHNWEHVGDSPDSLGKVDGDTVDWIRSKLNV